MRMESSLLSQDLANLGPVDTEIIQLCLKLLSLWKICYAAIEKLVTTPNLKNPTTAALSHHPSGFRLREKRLPWESE